jgi:NAD+ synthase
MVAFDQSVPWKGLVIGTGNKTEALLGYSTNYGDNACAFNPIGDLYKSQVRQLAIDMGVPEQILAKAPSADLWPGQTDEAEMGLAYEELDRLLYWMVDRRRTRDQLIAAGFDGTAVDRVTRMVTLNEFKRQVPPVAKLTTRTPGVDYLYPRRRPTPRSGG